MALLEVRNLQVNYGPIQAVKGIDLDVEKGTLVALLGANGAGKTTTLRAITGMVKAYGSVHLGETEILGQRGYKTARMGVNMSPEGRLIFAGLTPWRKTSRPEPIASKVPSSIRKTWIGCRNCFPF